MSEVKKYTLSDVRKQVMELCEKIVQGVQDDEWNENEVYDALHENMHLFFDLQDAEDAACDDAVHDERE